MKVRKLRRRQLRVMARTSWRIFLGVWTQVRGEPEFFYGTLGPPWVDWTEGPLFPQPIRKGIPS